MATEMTTDSSLPDDATPVVTEDATPPAVAELDADQPAHAATIVTDTETAAPAESDEAEPVLSAIPAEPRTIPAGASDVTEALRKARAAQVQTNEAEVAPAAQTDTTEAASTKEPAATEPAATELAATEPATTEPAATEPANPDPANPEPAAVEPTNPDPEATEPPALTYEALIATMEEPQRAVIEQHITGLKGALQAERTTVKRLETQVRTMQQLTDEKTRLEADVAARTAEVEQATRRATFYEHALDQGVRRKSVRLAYLAALDAGLLGEDGSIGWDDLRTHFTDLFEAAGRSATPPSRSTSAAAGAGARVDAPAAPTLNQIIRNAAGRR